MYISFMGSSMIKYHTCMRPQYRKKRQAPDLHEIDYKNVSMLSNYTDSANKILGRKLSGLDAKKQRAMQKAIKQARSVGLMPF